jgi:hypothetical protein
MVIGGKPCRGRAFDLWDCHECFYEKVVKVRADVAALHIFSLLSQDPSVAWRVVKGVAVRQRSS